MRIDYLISEIRYIGKLYDLENESIRRKDLVDRMENVVKENNKQLLIEYEIFKRGESLDSDIPNGTKIDVFLNSRN